MQMTEADESLSNYMKCNKVLCFCHAGFQKWKCGFYVVTHLSRPLLFIFRRKNSGTNGLLSVTSFFQMLVASFLQIYMGGWMRSVVLSVYGTVTQTMKRVIYYSIVGPDLFLPLKELALFLWYCYWSSKKAGAHPQVSSLKNSYLPEPCQAQYSFGCQ